MLADDARGRLLEAASTARDCLVVTWLALGVAYFSVYPVGFYVSTLGFAAYVLASAGRAVAGWFATRVPRHQVVRA